VITAEPRDSLTPSHMRLARIPERYWKASFEDFPDDYDGKKEVGAYLEKIIENLHDGIGMLFWGLPGHGKTHMGTAVLKRALAHTATGLFLEASSIQSATIEKKNLDIVQRPLVEVAQTVDLLLLDDFGAEHANPFSKVLVESLVRSRGMRNKATIITTNLKLEKIPAAYGEAFASAMSEYVFPIRIQGKDWRRDKAAALKKRFEG